MGLVGLVLQILGTGVGAMLGRKTPEQLVHVMSGAMGLVSALVGTALSAFIIYGGMQMKALRSWPVAIAAAIAAILSWFPCISPCCCLGIFGVPVGIWALIVLMDAEVKAAFTS